MAATCCTPLTVCVLNPVIVKVPVNCFESIGTVPVASAVDGAN
jgi:hypothetical protein